MWDNVRLNHPGDPGYSPMLSWMLKFRRENKDLAVDFTTYVDEYRVESGLE